MSEAPVSGNDWSKTPPGQARNPATSSKGSRGGKGKGESKGKGDSRPSQNDGNGQAQWREDPRDEMNLRDASSPRIEQSHSSQQAKGSRTPPAKGKGKGKTGQGKGSGQREQQSRDDDSRGSATADTIIGKGFTAAMKRGVAQAKPTPMHEEMVPQKDGGFIATIQKGFEGLFGKPTSKEEVLRKRGAVWANEYEAVPGDEVDQRVQFFARRLPEDVAGCLKIYRTNRGQYQINTETVTMEQRFRQNVQGQTDKEIFVFWTTEEGEQSDLEPLGLYLSHAANVAYEVKQGGNVITQVPEHARMSFHEEQGTKLTDGSADARFNAMEVAARQAKMREEAAMEWREKQNNPQASENTKLEDNPNEGGSMIDDALQAIGFMGQAPAPAPAPVSQQLPSHLAAPAAANRQMQQMQAPMRSMQPQMGSTAGTFYGVPQAQPGQQWPRQGTMYETQLPRQGTMYETQQLPRQAGSMYAYGSAAPPAAMPPMASAPAGYQAGYPAPMQQSGSMYAYGSAYAVPVR